MEWSDSGEEHVFSDEKQEFEENEIHIRKQNRKGRKWITTIENIPEEYDINDLLGNLKRKLSCNGSITVDPAKNRKIVQVQGNHGQFIREYLKGLFNSHTIIFHGN